MTDIVKKALFVLLLLAIAEGSLSGQQSVRDTTSQELAKEEKKSSFTTIFYGEPGKAALYSLIIPGGGQIYNRRFWKVPIVYAGEGFAAYYLIESLRSFRRLDRCRRSLIEAPTEVHSDCVTDGETITTTSEAFTEWQSARATKETAWIIMSAAHLLSVVEAFVDRHLINFDTSEDLSFHNIPDANIVGHHLELQPLTLLSFKISLNAP